jgi:hypothetical protein
VGGGGVRGLMGHCVLHLQECDGPFIKQLGMQLLRY